MTKPTLIPPDAKLPALANVKADETMLGHFLDWLGKVAVNLVVAALILIVTFWVARWLSGVAKRGLGRVHRKNPDPTLEMFLSSLVRYAIVVVGLVAVLQQLGVQATSIIAVLGAASLAIGLALQGALSNVAAGVMILIFRPYRVGDVVTIAGRTGQVKRLDLFNTELIDADGLKVVAPNGKAFSDVIVNSTDIPRRRIELPFVLEYGEDLDRAAKLALACAKKDPRILKDPAPWAKPTEISGVNVTLTVRVWTGPQAFADARVDLMNRIKQEFDASEIRLYQPSPPPEPPRTKA